ncbi:FUSC family protein [Streptomyces sp. MB09-01]|uniref:FUSC family protein n=1 Tax=Streptomyces sp. MB09-01 TaxID=3028666 RepID=UPI003A5BB2B8
MRHAVPVTAVVRAGLAIGHALPFGHACWAPMASVMVARRNFSQTFSRPVARFGGILVGRGGSGASPGAGPRCRRTGGPWARAKLLETHLPDRGHDPLPGAAALARAPSREGRPVCDQGTTPRARASARAAACEHSYDPEELTSALSGASCGPRVQRDGSCRTRFLV